MTKNKIIKLRAAVLQLTVVVLIFLYKDAVAEGYDIYRVKQDSVPAGLRLSTFDIDATPPVGSSLAYDKMINNWDLGLRARGIVLLGSGRPIVLCAVDWEEISNEGMDEFKNALAAAAGTTPQRVSVHVLHQHDAPLYDPGAENMLIAAGIDLSGTGYEGSFARQTIRRLADAVRNSLNNTMPVTHVGFGKGTVKKVASTRNVYGADGKRTGRMSSTRDSFLLAAPEGLIDPEISMVSFWNNDKALAVLTYYATHPQSYYRTGIPNPDFPGVARFFRQLAVPDALHVHFDGAGGNIAAGKYNDGSHENRLILAQRMAEGMKQAWESTKKEPVTASGIDWITEPVALPPAKYLYRMQNELKTGNALLVKNKAIAQKMVWLKRCESGIKMEVSCLKINKARVLYMPGELFVEYQLAAKAERPDLFVAMAAYGDLGMEYVGTAKAYEIPGWYEVSEGHSGVGPDTEPVLMKAIKTILQR